MWYFPNPAVDKQKNCYFSGFLQYFPKENPQKHIYCLEEYNRVKWGCIAPYYLISPYIICHFQAIATWRYVRGIC